MRQSTSDYKYRSIKYSISASSFKKSQKQNMHHGDSDQFRLSVCKENNTGVQRPKTSNLFKKSNLEKRWNNNSTSSSYKLRLVANSSHVKRQQADKQGEDQGQEQVMLLKSNYITPYEDYCCNLQEIFQALPPLLHADKLQTRQIKIQLQIIKQKAQSQLKQTEQYFCHEINKLRTLMTHTFKAHSRQIINARQNMSMLQESLLAMQGKCLMISEQIVRMNDNFNG